MSTTTVTCTCWCDSDVRVIPVEWLEEGRTEPCDLPGCEPGCPTRDIDAFDEPFTEPEPVLPVPVQLRKRMTTMDYDPIPDSSPETEALRDAYPGLILTQGPGLCECGCRTDQTRKTRFLPGHDARLKGKLQRAQAADAQVHIVDALTGTVLSVDARAVATGYGWAAIVTKGAERIIARSSTPIAAEKRLAKQAEEGRTGWTLLEFGRWAKTGRASAIWQEDSTGRVEIVYVATDGQTITVDKSALQADQEQTA